MNKLKFIRKHKLKTIIIVGGFILLIGTQWHGSSIYGLSPLNQLFIITFLRSQLLLKSTLTGHSDFVHSLAISPDGQTLVSGSYDDTIKIWRLK